MTLFLAFVRQKQGIQGQGQLGQQYTSEQLGLHREKQNKKQKRQQKMIERIKHAHLGNQDHCFPSCGTIPDW